MSIENELVSYLKKASYRRFMLAWEDKYRRLGHLGGKIILENLNEQERHDLGMFLGLDLTMGTLQMSYSQFLKKLATTRFENVDFEACLKLYDPSLQSNAKQKETSQRQLAAFKKRILEKIQNEAVLAFFTDYFAHDKSFKMHYHEEAMQLEKILIQVRQSLMALPQEDILLAVFSQNTTGDPHYYDQGTAKDVLLKGIRFLTNQEGTTNQLLASAHLINDPLSNYCSVCHISPQAVTSSWYPFYQNYEPWNVNLLNIQENTIPFIKQAVYIVENPAVFYVLYQDMKQHQDNWGLICSFGQINLCTYQLLDQLVSSECQLYYAGDFDPEGLLIADKLKQRYQDQLTLWGYEESLFKKVQVKSQKLNQTRLKQHEKLTSPTLSNIATLIEKHHCVGYQEGLIADYLNMFKKRRNS